MGRNLIMELVRRKYAVQALRAARLGHKLPHGCKVIPATRSTRIPLCCRFPRGDICSTDRRNAPNPAKKDEFRAVDLGSARASIDAAREAGVRHFVYVSVAQPAPMMKFYLESSRRGGEDDS